jgi:CPA2 family monovalent cation:H+ antiporter-2
MRADRVCVQIRAMHEFDLILTIAGGLSAALVFGYITQRLGVSPIVGYLIAGTLVGPHTPGFVADPQIAGQLAEVGVILLMFGVGLQLHVEELFAVRRIAVVGAIVQSVAATALGIAIARLAGWGWAAGVVFGMALSVASTVVLIRVLSDHRDLHTPTGHVAVGWLVAEDLFTVVALVLLPALFGSSPAADSSLALALGVTMIKVVVLIGAAIVVGNRVIPLVLEKVAATQTRELFTLTILVIALGIAVASARWFGVSMALGAFLAGLIVGRSDFSVRAASEALPMRDAFAVLFFVAVGMLLEPRFVFEAPGLIAATLAVILLGKPIVALLIVRILGYPFRIGLSIAIALAQIGEFSFLLSDIGTRLGLLSPEATNTIVVASIVSIILNPLLYRLVAPIERWAAAHPHLWAVLNPRVVRRAVEVAPARGDSWSGSVVIGYGPTGRTVTRLLRENRIDAVVVELNLTTVRALRDESIAAIYGDATRRETLEQAGIAGARSLILTSSGMADSAEVIRMAREINPRILILARTAYLRDVSALREAGADTVFSAEGEVALAFTESILTRLGATPEQIDRERGRAHSELFGRDTVV